jgi:hypothetical protein
MTIDDVLEELKNAKSVKFNELLKICKRFFGNPGIEGSHHIFKIPWHGNPRINIQKDGPDAKKYQVKQVRQALVKLKEQMEQENEKAK